MYTLKTSVSVLKGLPRNLKYRSVGQVIHPKRKHLSRFSETLRDSCESREDVCVTVELVGGVLPPNVQENKPLLMILILVYSCLQGSVQMLF